MIIPLYLHFMINSCYSRNILILSTDVIYMLLRNMLMKNLAEQECELYLN